MPLLLVHAICIVRKILWAMAFYAMASFFRGCPFCRLPSAIEVFIQLVHYCIDDLSGNLGTSFIFFF
ncbi:hypothetical protein PCS_03383 [Desulfocurvibacter africanus PCS]|uniref:Uncharacterized protein n=1 Tax=Desulfocurvibacter africanus PCS TaxID=1262666 RepID=M5PPM8_DESAF|nr:hypothetical protein PCS_03383 [Desulfocurvibacter africanus PCS]